MPETSLYGKSHNLANVRVLKDPEYVGTYHTYVDGTEIHGVTAVDVSFAVGEIPTAVIELNSVTKIDHDLLTTFRFNAQSITECLKFLSFRLQIDDGFRHDCMHEVEEALKWARDHKVDDEDAARVILDRLFFK